MISVGFTPAANKDLVEAVRWYENQQSGLGARFVEDFDRVLSRIEESRDQFPVVYRDTRRALLSRFPFGMFFESCIIEKPVPHQGVSYNHKAKFYRKVRIRRM